METLSPLALVNLLISSDAYHRQSGISYGTKERHKLDVYVPKGKTDNSSMVIFFYGGSWQRGRRKDYAFIAEALTTRGFVVVIPDYRVYPEVRFPTFLEDGSLAVSWVRRHIGGFGGDASRLFLMGHSAGAYIAAMLALNSSYLEKVGASSQEVRGFIGLAGPYDFLPLKNPTLIKIFGGSEGIPETQPVNFVRAKAPPALLLHGAADKLVRPRNTRNLSERLKMAGGQVVEIIYPGLKHIGLLLSLATPFQNGKPLTNDIARFIQTQTV